MNGPNFSIIMPAFNSDRFISDAISSVISQTYSDWELIVVDDGSTDETHSLVEIFCKADSRIIFVHLEKNSGVAIARNEGIRRAAGRYISFLDSDDVWMNEKLARQVEVLERGQVDVICSAYIRFGKNEKEKLICPPVFIDYKKMLGGNKIGNLTGSYNSEKLGKFFQKSIGHEDYLMWLDILRVAGSAIGIQDPLARYRVGHSSVSANKLKAFIWTWHIYRRELKMGVSSSLTAFCKYLMGSFFKII